MLVPRSVVTPTRPGFSELRKAYELPRSAPRFLQAGNEMEACTAERLFYLLTHKRMSS